MKILDATVEDAGEILALQKLAYLSQAEIYGDYSIPPLTQTIEELKADFARKLFLKAVVEGRIIGSVNGYLDRTTCVIGRLMVHPDKQGQGIGSRLMRMIESRFADAESWELFTGELSTGNIRLYEKLGYRVVRKEPFQGGRFSIVFMSKNNRNQ